MAKIHVISRYARLYPLAHRLYYEGHEVSFFADPTFKPSFLWNGDNGPKVSFDPPTEAADFYLLDPRGIGGFGADLVRERKMLLGGCRLTSKVDSDIDYHNKLVRQLFSQLGEGEASLPCGVFGLFNGEKWLEPQGLILYQSRLMEGERGPHLGVSGILLTHLQGRLAEEASSPQLTEFLTKAAYRGPVHISMRVGPEALHFDGIDFTLAPPTLLLWQEVSKAPLYETLFGLSTNMLKRVNWRSDAYSLGVRLSFTPPSVEEIEGDLLEISDYKHIWPDAGVTPPVLHLAWVTARGVDPQEARRRAHRTITLTNPRPLVQYRRDLGSTLESHLRQLSSWGWM